MSSQEVVLVYGSLDLSRPWESLGETYKTRSIVGWQTSNGQDREILEIQAQEYIKIIIKILKHILSRITQFKNKIQRSGLSSKHQRLYSNSMLYTHYAANMPSVLSTDHQRLHYSTSLQTQGSGSMN
jgi:hypothetical protein